MADAITIKALQDASLDAKSLEEVVNGSETKQVTTRLGESYPSIKKAVTQVFENGGLPATPFKTKALMTASALVDGKYAMVTDDTVNNGLYVKTSGAWVKSEYDPLAQSKNYTDTKNTNTLAAASIDATNKSNTAKNEAVSQTLSYVNNSLESGGGSDLFVWADSEGNIVKKITADGHTHTATLNGSLESNITNISEIQDKTEKSITTSSDGDLLKAADVNGDIYLRVAADGSLYLPRINGSLQDAINEKTTGGVPLNIDLLRKLRTTDVFEPAALSLLSFGATQEIGAKAPAPMGIYKQQFDIGKNWIDNISLQVDPPFTPLVTPYGGDNSNIHPNILEFPNGFNGWRYIKVTTGYGSGETVGGVEIENPFLYGSNDLANFELLTGVLDAPDSVDWEWGIQYNSDAVLAHDPITNELVIIWRRYKPATKPDLPPDVKSRAFFYAIRTRDLKTFTEKELIWESIPGTANEQDCYSPAFIYDAENKLWHMFGVRSAGRHTHDTGIMHFTNHELGVGWTFKNYISMNVDSRPWHIDAKWVGKRVVLFIHERLPGELTGLRFGIQDNLGDFTNFTWAANFFNQSGAGVYKGTFCPEFDKQGQMRLHILWTHALTNAVYTNKLFVHTTDYMNVGRIN